MSMTLSLDVSTLSLFLLILFLYLLTRHVLLINKNLPPSPGFSLPIIGHLYLFKKPLHRTLATLSNKYGPILFLRFGSRPVVLVSSPSAAEECFTKNDVVFANRPRLLAGKHLGYNYTTLTWAPYGQHWRNLRRIASLEILSSARLQLHYHIRLDEVRSLVRKLFSVSKEGKFDVFDMKSVFFELGLNVLMRMIAGKRYYRGDEHDVEEATAFKEIVTETFEVSGATNMGDFVPILKWFNGNALEKRLEALQRKRDRFMQKIIEERKRGRGELKKKEGGTKTMIDVLLELQESEPEYYTDEIIRCMSQVIISAGTDTSVGTMEWALSLLLNNPEALSKAQAEMDQNLAPNKLLEESDLSNLPYLNGIINETLRMYTVAPMLVPHESSEECTLAGYCIPRGTMLLVNLWAIQNDPKTWEDPGDFRPERFMGPEGARDGYVMFPFGSGRRGCPGEALARKMVAMGVGSLVQCFEWNRSGDELVDMAEGNGLTMPKAQPLFAKCRPRPVMLELLSQL